MVEGLGFWGFQQSRFSHLESSFGSQGLAAQRLTADTPLALAPEA